MSEAEEPVKSQTVLAVKNNLLYDLALAPNIEIEIPINPPNIPYDDIDWNGITSMNIEFTKIMTDIAFTGNEEYLNLINNYSNNV